HGTGHLHRRFAAISVPVRAGRPRTRTGQPERHETPEPVRQNAMDPGFHAVAGWLGSRREVTVGLEFPAVPGGQDDLAHEVGAQAELLRDLFRAPSLLVVEQREFLLGLGPRPTRG